MTANIVNLGGMDDEDGGYQSFVADIQGNATNAIFWIEKDDGTIRVGCNYDDRRDLVYALYKIQNLVQSVLQQEGE